jgi:hypothetical protein
MRSRILARRPGAVGIAAGGGPVFERDRPGYDASMATATPDFDDS